MSLIKVDIKRSKESELLEEEFIKKGVSDKFKDEDHTRDFLNFQKDINNKKYHIGKKIKINNSIMEKSVSNMQFFVVNNSQVESQKAVIYIPGGEFVEQPAENHWLFVDKLASLTKCKIYVPIYPKVPNYSYKDAYPKLISMYKLILNEVESASLITIMGDSAGGNIALSLVELIGKKKIPSPQKLILISPAVDMSINLSQQERDIYESVDPIVKATDGTALISKLWADGTDLKNPILSPINGKCPTPMSILVFVGTHETLYPSIIKLDERFSSIKDVEINTFVYPSMDHVFVIDNLPESQDAIDKMIKMI